MEVMIEKIELWLNIVHYCIYKADYKLHMLSNKLNPFLLLGKIPAVKRKLEEQGTNLKEVGNNVWTDRQFGFGIMISGGGLVLIIFLWIFSVSQIVNGLLNHPIKLSWRRLFIICSILSCAICYLAVFQKDRYIRYFKQFDKWSKHEKRKYGVFSLAFVVGTFALWIYSFRFISPS